MATRKTTTKVKSTDKNLITLDSLIQESNKYDELIDVKFGDERYTKIYSHFSPTRIDAMLDSFSNFISTYSDKIGKLMDSKVLDYLNLHILLYFSKVTDHVDFTFEEKVDILNQILDSETAEKIFESFKKEEIEKVYTRMFKKIDAYQDIIRTNKDMKQQMIDFVANSDLDNKELIESFMLQNDPKQNK